jgi:hypothetical protein
MTAVNDVPPDRWLQARCFMLQRKGLHPLEALKLAFQQWNEMAELERQFNAERERDA